MMAFITLEDVLGTVEVIVFPRDYEKYKQEGPAFLEKYDTMLKETPVRSVEDVAKICDIDLTKKEFWLMSLHSYDEAIAEYKRLVAK